MSRSLQDVEEVSGQFGKYLIGWVENLLDNLISVKLWFLGICVWLCYIKLITGTEFVTCFGIVLGLRETYKIAKSYFAPKIDAENINEDDKRIIDKV